MRKSIILVFLCVISLFLVTGCDITKKAITTNDFKNITEKKGLFSVDVKEQFKDLDYIKEATVAASQEGWQLEFYVLSDADQAKSMYNKNYKIFSDYKSSNAKSTKMEVLNYTKFTLETSDFYRALTRVDNTFLYVEVPIKFKDKAKEIIEELGY